MVGSAARQACSCCALMTLSRTSLRRPSERSRQRMCVPMKTTSSGSIVGVLVLGGGISSSSDGASSRFAAAALASSRSFDNRTSIAFTVGRSGIGSATSWRACSSYRRTHLATSLRSDAGPLCPCICPGPSPSARGACDRSQRSSSPVEDDKCVS